MLRGLQGSDLLIGIALWVGVYLADYYMTIWGNRLWMQYGKDHIQFGGSYELNPIFQKDVDALKLVSRRFVIFLLVYAGLLLLMWLMSVWIQLPQLFQFFVGSLVLMEVPILDNHVQNITLFRQMKNPGAVEGQIRYARWIGFTLYRSRSAYWMVIYTVLFLITGSWFIAGGAFTSVSSMMRHAIRGNFLRRQAPTVAKKPPVTETSETLQ